MDLTPGVIVASRYRLDSLSGSGGMGSVWKATDLRLKRTVALKVLHTDLRADPSLTARFQREAELLASIEHRAIVPIHDIVTIEDNEGRERPCIVMGYVKGDSLAQVIQRFGRLKLDHAVGILRSLLEALGAAHAAGIIHRDLKPQNVVLEEVAGQAQVRLLDFGIAKSMGAVPSSASVLATQAGMLLGTPGYMSPEQMTDPTAVDPRADLWAAAVCFFEMLTAQVPFPGATAVETVSRVLSDAPLVASQVNPALPRAVDEFFARAFVRDIAQRPRSAAEMLKLLEPLAIGREPTVPFVWPPPGIAARMNSGPVGASTHRYGSPTPASALPATSVGTTPAPATPPPYGSSAAVVTSPPGAYGSNPAIANPPPAPYGSNPALVTPPPGAYAPYGAGPAVVTPPGYVAAAPTPVGAAAHPMYGASPGSNSGYATPPAAYAPAAPPAVSVSSGSNAIILAPGSSPLALVQDGGTYGAIQIPTSGTTGAIQPAAPSSGATDSAIRRRLGIGLGLLGFVVTFGLACVGAIVVAVYWYLRHR